MSGAVRFVQAERRLTSLGLHSVPSRFQPTTEELLAMLRSMQDLTELYLDDALASATSFLSGAAFNSSQKIDVPHLSRLLIAAPLSTVVAFLSCVNIPLNTEVRLQCYHERDSSLDDCTLLAIFGSFTKVHHVSRSNTVHPHNSFSGH